LTRVISFVSNDIVSDNRVHKTALSLIANGYNLKIVGRIFRNSKKLPDRPYDTYRFRLWFNTGPLFYANLNIRIFLYLLWSNVDIILSNDLDTLPACWLAAKLRKKKLVFDSHELFPEVPELVYRPIVRNIWLMIEKTFIKRIHYAITVSSSIAGYYKSNYGKRFEVIRNVGYFRNASEFKDISKDPDVGKIIYQGALNIGRGLELAIQSMHYVNHAKLQIVGDGDIYNELKQLTTDLGLESKVEFIDRVPLEELWKYTVRAHIGLSLEEDLGLNYQFALPNKLFDYIQARIPIVVSDLHELRAIVNQYRIGRILHQRTPEQLGKVLTKMLFEELPEGKYLYEIEIAAGELCWEREEKKLIGLFRHVNTSA